MKEQTYIEFESYINNEMTSEEKTIFEIKLQNEPDLKENLDLYKETTDFASHKFSTERNAFQENLKVISAIKSSETKNKNSKIISLRNMIYAVAAVFVLFFGIQLFQNNTPEYFEYNQHENATFVERGNVIEALKLAQDAFNTKDYKQAIIQFEIVLKEYPRPAVQYFYAISLLEENRFADSELVLNQLIKGKTIYKNTATWYLALSKLKQKEYVACKTVLLTIPEDYEDYDKVKELLGKLD